MFWERFYNLCELKNIKPNNLAKEIDVSSGLITKWKQGFTPNTDALCKIADYFSVTTDYLLGRSDSSSEEPKSSSNELSKYEQEFFGIFKNLTTDQQNQLIGMAKLMAIQNEEEQTIRVYRAAESTDDHDDEILNISAERLQKLKNAPESDDDDL